MSFDARVAALRTKLKEKYATWQDAYADEQCRWLDKSKNKSIDEWIIRSIWDPRDPGSAPVPDPDVDENEVLPELFRRFGV